MKVIILSLLLVALIVSTEAAGMKIRKMKAMKVMKDCVETCNCAAEIATVKSSCKAECTGPKKLFCPKCQACAATNGGEVCFACMKKCLKDNKPE